MRASETFYWTAKQTMNRVCGMELSNQRRNDRFPSARAVAHTLPKRDPGSPPAPHDSTHTYIAIVDPRHQAPKSARPRAFPARVWVGFGAWPSCGASTTSRRLPWGFESQGKSSRAFAFRSRIFLPCAAELLELEGLLLCSHHGDCRPPPCL